MRALFSAKIIEIDRRIAGQLTFDLCFIGLQILLLLSEDGLRCRELHEVNLQQRTDDGR
jgi:hypothetical protein